MTDQPPPGQGAELDRVEARAGSTPGVVRYILGISLVLIVVLFALVLVYYA